MDFSSIVVQFLNGLAGASSLFLVAAGLSLIFGVTRVVNFAHGSFYMLGLFLAYSLAGRFGGTPTGFWISLLVSALVVGVVGALVEIVILRRTYRSPELFQLLATFAVVLVIKDVALAIWGADSLLGRRAPGLSGSFQFFGKVIPAYDLVLIAAGPVVLGLLWLIVRRTRFGRLVRAATQDREMVGALGVNEAWLFTGVFFLGSFLAGLGGAIVLPREPANLSLDIAVIADAFVVVVVGGMGSLPGAYLAALLIAEVKALCIAIGDVSMFGYTVSFSRLTLVVEFVVMAVVLVVRPYGLLGRPSATPRAQVAIMAASRPPRGRWILLVIAVLAVAPLLIDRYSIVLLNDVLVFALFAASLHFFMGTGGMISFGHAAYFGIGAYAAALLLKRAGLQMEVALTLAPVAGGIAALFFGWFCVRLSGVYLAMLTLAFAQIAWSIAYQWDALTGGSNGMVGVWPAAWLADKAAFYWLTLGVTVVGVLWLWRMASSPFGYGLRAGRDSPLRAEALGIDVRRQQWFTFGVVGAVAAAAGALYAFSKGSISPDVMGIQRSVDALVMVLLGGVHSLVGPLVGAAVLTWLQDEIIRDTEYWRGLLGLAILALVLLLPQGLAGARDLWRRKPA